MVCKGGRGARKKGDGKRALALVGRKGKPTDWKNAIACALNSNTLAHTRTRNAHAQRPRARATPTPPMAQLFNGSNVAHACAFQRLQRPTPSSMLSAETTFSLRTHKRAKTNVRAYVACTLLRACGPRSCARAHRHVANKPHSTRHPARIPRCRRESHARTGTRA